MPQCGDEEIIKELCVCNGISHEKVSQDGRGISALEMFFSGFPRMVGLSLFPSLSTLTVVGQCIRHIQGLEHCPLLKELWVVECHINEISGLEKCTQLQKLFLYDNKISEITGLDHLTNLQILWLNSNQISEIKGLSSLENLRELNLTDNLIKTIGDSLDQNNKLQILNLSGNKIISFKELTRLACLSGLRELGLKDPLCQPNPVCLLCNYVTHVLYHMPALQRLDSYDVSSKLIKEAAESTVMKKMMYYNMRVRWAQRQFDDSKARLLQHRTVQLKLPEERIRTLSYTLKNLERELSEVGRKSTRLWEEDLAVELRDAGDPLPNRVDLGYEQKVQHKLDSVRESIKIWEQRLEQVEESFQQDIKLASDRKELLIHFLVMELETVGNIRFEEGNPSDVWFKSCYDLLLFRFCVWDYKPYNITGIKINRIMRIHNCALRLRFEDKLHSLLDRDESPLLSQNYKRWLEYLFYVPDPEQSTENNESLQILEEGFRSAENFEAVGRDRAVPLTNSVSVCEQLRIRHAQRQAAEQSVKPPDPLPFRHGQLIVSKVFLGPSVPVKDGVPVDPDLYPKVHSVYQKASETLFSTEQQASCDCSQQQTLWYVFDHELVLPEYLIDFEYITEDTPQASCPYTPSSVAPVPVDPAPVPPLSCYEQTQDEMTLALEPVLVPRLKMLALDELSILATARANVLSQITVLNLHGNSLTKLKEISCLTALRHLTISFNELTHLDDISHLPSLENVDASFNRVATLEGVHSLGRLRHLDLRWNQLTRARDDAAVLRKHAPCLLHLDTRHNPWSRHDSVRMVLLGRLKTLTHLDGVLVTEEESTAALEMSTTSKINQACLLAHSRITVERPRCLSLLSVAQLLTNLKPSPWTHTELEPGWAAKITALNVDGQHLSRITNLDKLVSLRWASFNDNDLTRIEGLEHCPLLEELSLNNNKISSLDGLYKLQHLVRLNINCNQLQSLDGSVLDCLPNLHFLSAESNCISSLHGVQRSRSLFELYAGNNDISTSRNIYHLKALSSLIILDLLGNPLVKKLENYRAYVVFHLPSLKALDGVAVELAESENAKDLFGGRLIPDMVAEKLGHSNFRDIVNLELTACSIRMVDLAPADLFGNLRCINLEHNNLTSFSGLVYLPSVKALCLNYNHIESILPRQKTQTHLSSRQVLYQKVHSSGYGQQNHSKNSREGVSGDSLEPLMASLEELHLCHNSISSLGELQLSRLTNLKALFLQGNEISQVEGLEGLRHLRQLVLDRNRIKILSEGSLSRQESLLELHLAENRLRDLSHLGPLTQLRRLFLDMNKLQDTAELDKLEDLPSLIELSVVGNPMAKRSLHRPAVVVRLPRLQVLDGITITLEEQTRSELMYNEGQYLSPPVVGADVLTLPGLLPLCRALPGRGTCLTSGLQHLLGHEIITTPLMEEPHHNSKYKKRAGGTHVHSAQSDGSYRQRGASSFHTTGLQPSRHRVYTAYTNTDPETRCPSHSGPKPPPM
ncbi:leucine-rich repeat-containing protein 9 isoform X1 [Electrophorus electricus]|uniref:leucine-rich repeat-containing protein 9 isoform X1 n=1 Tax=Electrophorus electricus TaxID=8005 RepID=UPI0015D08ECD|nr:leucine-rich repeat-containing protein 9 isoform X1 [Electrophorus electricus]